MQGPAPLTNAHPAGVPALAGDADLAIALAERWLAWQWDLWRPWFDLWARSLDAWPVAVWPMPALLLRGTEQLA